MWQLTPFSPFGTLKGLFELIQRTSRALNLALQFVFGTYKRYRETFWCVALIAEVPGHCQKKMRKTLIVFFLQ